MKIEVRDVLPTEGDLLRELRLQALRDAPLAFDSTVEREEARPAAFWQRLAAGRSDTSVTLLGLVDERPVGLAGGVAFPDEEHPQLVMMWVDPSSRTGGLGAMLVEAVVQWATEHDHDELRLWVAEDNAAARRLYERCGFVLTGARGPLPTHPHVIELEMSRGLL